MTHGRLIASGGALAALVLLTFVLLKAETPLGFSRPCRLVAQSEWLLMKTGPDTFEARLFDHRRGNHQQFDLFRVSRGDLVHFALDPSRTGGSRVQSGAVVAHLRSQENQALLDQLGLELREAQANLRAAETGEKAQIVDQLRSEVAAAQALATQKKSEFTRSQELRATGAISQAALELAEGEFRQAEAALGAARSGLQAAEAGEKDEVVSIHRAQVDLLEQRIRDAELRAASEEIRCPIAGEVATLQGDSALLRIVDVDTLYAFAPVPPSRSGWLQPGQEAEVRTGAARGERSRGELVSIDAHAATLAGRTFFWVSVAVPNSRGGLPPGVAGEVRFRGREVSLLTWLIDYLRHAGDRTLGV